MDRAVHAQPEPNTLRLAGLLGLAATIGLGAALGWKVAGLLPRAYALLSFPHELVYGEGTVLHESLLLQAGTNIYSPPTAGQFIAANYTPVYYLLNALLVSPAQPDFFAGRLISFVSGLLVALLIVAVVTRSARDLPAGLVGGALFLCLTQVNQWFVFYKPDLLALLFTAAGIYFMARRSPWLYAAVPFFLLAFYTKQSMVAAPLVAAAYLLARDRDRRSVIFTAALGIGVAAPFLALDFQSSHGFFVHVVSYNRRPWSYDQFAELIFRFVVLYRHLLIVAGALLLLQLKERRLSYQALYLPVAAITMLAAGSAGSARNYTLEVGLAASIAAGLMLRDLIGRRSLSGPLLLLVTLVLLGLQVQTIFSMPERLLGRRVANEQANERMDRLSGLVRQSPDPVLSENVGLLVTNGRTASYNDPFLMAQVAEDGRWDESGLVEQIRRKEFPFIILENDVMNDLGPQERWSDPVLDAIRRSYDILYRDVLFVYAPRGGP